MSNKQEQGEPVALAEYDAGSLNDYGGGNVSWWWDYIRYELGRAHDHYQEQVADLYNTPQQRKPLTDEQMRDCLDAADQMYCEKDGDKELFKARAIEAAHSIKE